ncbi:MAG TPA: response regulator transcription factor [Gemmatimonadales bacterium]|nr:response regulator transcription factor [Gemmatimonadales bacterium]
MAKRGEASSIIAVLVVDDHRTFAEALGVVFRMEKDFRVEVAANGLDAVDSVERFHPDVVLIDLDMPSIGGPDAIRRVISASSATKVLALSRSDEDLERAQAIEAGAVGFISRVTPLQDLPDAIRKAARGEAIMDGKERARLLRVLHHRRHQEATERQRVNRLTPRQTEILQMMAEGVPESQIAEKLTLSPNTLRTHVQNILTRLSVHTKVQALAVAIRHGKISARS